MTAELGPTLFGVARASIADALGSASCIPERKV